jgi:hypothetical protein
VRVLLEKEKSTVKTIVVPGVGDYGHSLVQKPVGHHQLRHCDPKLASGLRRYTRFSLSAGECNAKRAQLRSATLDPNNFCMKDTKAGVAISWTDVTDDILFALKNASAVTSDVATSPPTVISAVVLKCEGTENQR